MGQGSIIGVNKTYHYFSRKTSKLNFLLKTGEGIFLHKMLKTPLFRSFQLLEL